MTGDITGKPHLIFFRETPADLLDKPPLASSFQHLETAFLLISMRRFPHALISCASAIESALKAGLNIPVGDMSKFGQLLDKGVDRLPQPKAFTRGQLYDFREKRNKIIHYGFSTKDDEVSAELMLKTGLPLLEQLYLHLFGFSLCTRGSMYGGLLPEISDQFQVAIAVFNMVKDRKDLKFTYCFNAFGHKLRWGTQHWNMSHWQDEMLSEEHMTKMDYTAEFLKKICEDLGCDEREEVLDCPICDEAQSFASEFDLEFLHQHKTISIIRGMCANCNFTIYKNNPYLADHLFKNIITEEFTTKMLQGYGL
ncbi:hypothetical protein [Geomonas oryzae]|uniref:hypothetical protein n=1 Tax=Geomonas oryzae TaxID=2364273 RepID=UPI00100C0E26|nr:hypothetical protein [Geomonas oryzae]